MRRNRHTLGFVAAAIGHRAAHATKVALTESESG